MQNFQFVEQNTKTKYRKSDRPLAELCEKPAVFYPQNQKTLTSSEPKGERAKTQLAQEQLQAGFECAIPQPTTPLDYQKAERQKPQGLPNKFSEGLAALQ